MATRFCTQCGAQLDENSRFCTNCGAPTPASAPTPEPTPQPEPVRRQPVGPKPATYLALSILATIFCCLPFGIPAIVFAAKVDSHWNAGRYEEAQEASRKAKTWMLVSVILGAIVIISYFALVFYGVSLLGNDFMEELQSYR